MDYDGLNFDINDKLGRKKFVLNIMNVIDKWNNFEHENNSLTISINAPWGSGKSYLINMWRNYVLSKELSNDKYAVTYYNAWENDDCDNAFIPLTYYLTDLQIYGHNQEFLNKLKSKSKGFLKSCAVSLVKDGIKKAIGEETAKIISEGIKDAEAEKYESFFQDYNKYIEVKNKSKEELFDLIPEDGKLIVFIDELDRCRPTFAVETLEIIKHYFNIPNIVFIFAIDLEQLSYSISTMYGTGMDSQGYLRIL